MNGISQTIVDRANEIAALSARGENLIAACAVLSAQETQALEDAVGHMLSVCFWSSVVIANGVLLKGQISKRVPVVGSF